MYNWVTGTALKRFITNCGGKFILEIAIYILILISALSLGGNIIQYYVFKLVKNNLDTLSDVVISNLKEKHENS